MNYKTKAQELSFLSRDYAVAKDKKNWLALFDKNALVQDPIGKSPLDLGQRPQRPCCDRTVL
jgi:hypothetical protein